MLNPQATVDGENIFISFIGNCCNHGIYVFNSIYCI